ncbi:vesicle transport through interaction with t-SNAREs homolog 1A-like [Mizuhopecten yessoensis]|uniref:Vesicle transport through interaction with t-SNAREs homolog 1A n=1 Tax=Mizuhopecten yessoensis TaxID=6573 RepID=A0A210QX71_MIZYE|nr:vesicle transport through interaction with t-SNAREs homolog 1A-like [Mizuhopecten yessoensis]OWF53325.1 Vesicle transport through interaction with t-SNAREs-like 1A [Mizuhopecten yessoensis]
MASLIESYEQQYSNLTADITYNISKISNTHGAEKQKYIRQVDKLFDEVSELLEQMELEVKDLPSRDKQKYQTRVKSYKTELGKLQTDTRRAKLGIDSSRDELLGDDTHESEDQRKRLLDNTDALDRTSRRLDHGYRIALETEEMGAQVLQDLSGQRQTIQRSRNRLEEMNSGLGKSSRVLSGMMRRIIQNRLMLVIICAILLLVIGLAIYFIVKRNS